MSMFAMELVNPVPVQYINLVFRKSNTHNDSLVLLRYIRYTTRAVMMAITTITDTTMAAIAPTLIADDDLGDLIVTSHTHFSGSSTTISAVELSLSIVTRSLSFTLINFVSMRISQ